jgi:hypothetical protein
LEHSETANDDDIFGSAISTFILHDVDTMADRSKNQRRIVESNQPAIDLNPYGSISVPMRKIGDPKTVLDHQPMTIEEMIRSNAWDSYMH